MTRPHPPCEKNHADCPRCVARVERSIKWIRFKHAVLMVDLRHHIKAFVLWHLGLRCACGTNPRGMCSWTCGEVFVSAGTCGCGRPLSRVAERWGATHLNDDDADWHDAYLSGLEVNR